MRAESALSVENVFISFTRPEAYCQLYKAHEELINTTIT
jgi:hypothetical protein